MTLKNTPTQYGLVSRAFHWSIAFLVLIQFYLIYAKRYILAPGSERAGFYINGLHKPIGLLLLVLVIASLLWAAINIHPNFPASMSRIEKWLARIMHKVLLLGTLGMSLSGLVMTTASDYPPDFFGLYQVPHFIEKNKLLSRSCFEIHETVGSLLLCLVILHALAALKHHFIDKNDVLRRML